MKAKKFSRKLLAFFLALVMALSCFSGALSAFAAESSKTEYNDEAIAYNSLAWANLSDEQTCTAVLDYLDGMLGELNFSFSYSLDIVVSKINIEIDATSVDGLLKTIDGLEDLLNKTIIGIKVRTLVGGDIKNIDLTATRGMRRDNTSSTDIIRGLFKIIYMHTNDFAGKNVLKNFLRGTLDLGLASSFVDLYSVLGDLFSPTMGSNYENWQNDLVYNLVQNLILEYTGWFTDAEKSYIRDKNTDTPLDRVLLDKLSTELLEQINVCVTYNDGSTSVDRYQEYLETGNKNLINSNLTYTQPSSDGTSSGGNVYLFRYGSEKLSLSENDSFMGFAYRAFEMAWNTVLADTLGLLNSGTRFFDYDYYYWYVGKDRNNTAWDYSDVGANYTTQSVTGWAEYMCAKAAQEAQEDGTELEAQYKSAGAYIKYVENGLNYDRKVVDDPTYTWKDIDSTRLFNELRYSPLADYYFDMETGPLNLSFCETGLKNVETFMNEEFSSYTSLLTGVNDFLVALMADLFPQTDNTGTYSALTKTGNSTDASGIANALVGNACTLFQYAADLTDENILSGFYKDNGAGAVLTESNFEAAMIPFMISALKNISMTEQIHDSKWDACKDAEGVAAVALEEYLSFILPSKDYTSLMPTDGNGYYDVTLEGTLMPMCRDALGYILSSIVPLYDKTGEKWDPYTADVNSSVTIFDLLNSVIVYYGGTTTFKDEATGYGVANLLGICDTSGNCKITLSNTLWQNIDLLLNKLMPVAGTLQYGSDSYYGKASSQDFIENDIIKGFLNIGDTSAHSSGMGGISNFIYRMVTMLNASPVSSTGCVKTIYDLLADLINGVLGARYTGQSYTQIVPKASSNTPFDNLIKVNTLVGADKDTSDIGIVGKFVCNVYEFTGGVNSKIYPDTVMDGFAFAVQAVNSFLNIVPQLSDHTMRLATADVTDSAVNSAKGAFTTKLNVHNNSVGVNRAYVNDNSSVTRLSRYYVRVTNIAATNFSVSYTKGTMVVPDKSVSFNISGTYPSTETTVRYTITYDVVDKSGNLIAPSYSGLTCFAYQYITPDKGWKEAAYFSRTDGNEYQFDDGSAGCTSLESTDPDKTMSCNGVTTKTTAGFGTNANLNILYPTDMVIGTNSLSDISKYSLRVRNNGAGTRNFDGVYCYDEKPVYDDRTKTTVTVGKNNAIPCYDKTTGDILNYDKVDYSTNNGVSWTRGAEKNDSTLVALLNSGSDVQIRTNVAFTLTEAIAKNIIAAYHEEEGIYEYIYLQNGTSTDDRYDKILDLITCSTPIDGLYLTAKRQSISKSTSIYFNFIAYDGSTQIPSQETKMNLVFYHSDTTYGSGSATINFIICDNSNTSTLESKYREVQNYLTNYRQTDFVDYDDSTESSAIYNQALSAMRNALSSQGTPMTVNNALSLSDTTSLQNVTRETDTINGDAAFVPVSSSNVTTVIRSYAYEKAIGGTTYYFLDSLCKFPIYSNVALNDSNVTITGSVTVDGETHTTGTDATGQNVVKVGSVWYIMNEQAYNYKWDNSTYSTPCQVKDKDSVKEGRYNQVQYVYRDASGAKCTSRDSWACKFAETSYQMIENTGATDNRGTYTKAIDYMSYAIYDCDSNVSDTVAKNINDKVSSVRYGLNNVNFKVSTYEAMVQLAKSAEDMYYANIYKVGDANKTVLASCNWDAIESTIEGLVNTAAGETASNYSYYFTTNSSSLQIEEAIRVFELYMGKTIERGFMGDKLAKEIVCASGSSYDKMTTSYDADKNATISTSASTSAYGAVENGKLVNNGSVIYTAASWQAYINALAAAIDGAAYGYGSYNKKNSAYYVSSDKEDYTLQVSNVYSLKTDLQIAENNLAEPEVVKGFKVTGTTMQMMNTSGSYAPTGYAPGLTVKIGDLTATTASNGSFEIDEVPMDATTVVISGVSTVDRTITISAEDVVDGVLDLGKLSILCCDYVKNGSIDAADLAYFKRSYMKGSSSYYVFADLNNSGTVDGTDLAAFKSFYNKRVSNIYSIFD